MATGPSSRAAIAPGFLSDDPQWKRTLAAWMLDVMQGHLNNTGNVTLTSGVAATVLTDSRIGAFSWIGFMPQTANAAAEVATLFVASQSKGAATITHANAATGNRTFRYAILG